MIDDVKNFNYFKNKLKKFLVNNFSETKALTVSERELKDNLEKMIDEIEEHLYKNKNDILYQYKSAFISIIDELEEEIDFNRSQDKPLKTDFKIYNEKAYSKLNYIFRKQDILTLSQAEIKYNDYQILNEKYNIFLELINWLNDNKLSIIPEKTLFSAFLGISVETYNDLLLNSKNEQVRLLLKNIDEYFTTNQFGALINNDRKALERIQKTKTYGQEMIQTQPDVVNLNQTNVLSYNDIMQKIQRKNNNIIDYKIEE